MRTLVDVFSLMGSMKISCVHVQNETKDSLRTTLRLEHNLLTFQLDGKSEARCQNIHLFIATHPRIHMSRANLKVVHRESFIS